jgi:phenylalanine-4-hydroxylase
VFCLDDASPHRVAFDLARVMRTHHRIDDFQEIYFVLDDLDDLLALARVDFEPLYRQVAGLPECQPGDVLPSDRVLHTGSGAHAKHAKT